MNQEERASAPEAPQESAATPAPAVAQPAPAPAPKPAAKPAAKPGPKPAPKPAAVGEAKPIPLSPAPSGPTAAEIARQARRERARRLLRAVAIWVALPSVLGVIYYGFIAQPEYESVSTLVLTGGDAEVNAVLLREHMLSREVMARLDEQVDLSNHYAQGHFPSGLRDSAGSESRYNYFRDHIDARYEPHSRVFTLHVRAFSGKAAQRIATALMAEGTGLVDQVASAKSPWFVTAAKPSAPNEATHPRRVHGMLTVLLTSIALFGIGSLLVAAIREHAQF